MDNVIGELNNFWKVMDEIYRISKIGADIVIIVPYFRSSYAFIQPNLKSFFTVETFEFFIFINEKYKRYKYSNSTFEVKSPNLTAFPFDAIVTISISGT